MWFRTESNFSNVVGFFFGLEILDFLLSFMACFQEKYNITPSLERKQEQAALWCFLFNFNKHSKNMAEVDSANGDSDINEEKE